MINQTTDRDCCSTCGHIFPKPRRGLSSVEYRRIVRELSSFADLHNTKDKLVAIIRNVSRNQDFANFFSGGLNDHLIANEGFDIAKKWLFEQINILPNSAGEKDLYDFLRISYPHGIDEPFSVFYDKYCVGRGIQVMHKNYVSRALGAIGLKTKIGSIKITDQEVQRIKSTMFIRATGEELQNLFKGICY